MRQLHVCNVDEEGRFGGPERRIVQVAKALKQIGVETHVVYPQYESEKFGKEISKAGLLGSALKITRLSKERKILKRYITFFFVEIYRLCRFFRKHQFDLVHVNGSYQFKVAVAAKFAGIPVVWHLNDTKMDAPVKKICTFFATYCASGFIVAGQRVYDFYIRGTVLEQKPYIEIHAPVDTAVFNPETVISDTAIFHDHNKRVVTVSGINPTKGVEYFIEMADLLLRDCKDISFFVAGAELTSHKKYSQDIQELCIAKSLTDKMKFIGMLDNVPSFLKGADVCVFTSISEASPSAVWEAMSMGKAVVTTDVGSVRQYIEDGGSGFIVPVRDAGALSEKVKLLLNNPVLRQKIGDEARRVAQKQLDVSIAAQKHASFYNDIVSLSSH